MKKIFVLTLMLIVAFSANAQIVELYKGSQFVGSYNPTEVDKVIFKEMTKVTNIALSTTSAEIEIYKTLQLTATVSPSDATVSAVSWSSDNTSVATVSNTGFVTAQSLGTAVITATATDGSGIAASCTITVKNPAEAHEYVDLGLPSGRLWAKTNVGADKIEGAGNYFAWGETEQKSYYDQSYKYYKSTTTTTKTVDKDGFETTVTTTVQGYTKYVSNPSEGYDGFADYRTILDASDDAATVKWGSDWCMPSKEDWQELKDNCTWEWVSYNSVSGYKVTSKTNGNFLFLPSTGYSYWSCSLSYYMSCASGSYFVNSGNRYDRNRIRPVRMIKVTGVELSATSLELGITHIKTLSATISPASASKQEISWASSDSSVVRVSNGIVIGVSAGTATVTATATDGSGVSASCSVTVTASSEAHEYVDLGLSVKWATCNVGAENIEDYGDYFAWGETTPYYTSQNPLTWKDGKTTGYNWQSYCGSSSFTEWATPPYDSTTKILTSSNDAAFVNWGGDWRMPTSAELQELRDNCNWTWTNINGVNGYVVSSKVNDNSIFLPAAGCRSVTYLSYAGSGGYYWSSSLYTDGSNVAWVLSFGSGDRLMYDGNRYVGLSVRPVR